MPHRLKALFRHDKEGDGIEGHGQERLAQYRRFFQYNYPDKRREDDNHSARYGHVSVELVSAQEDERHYDGVVAACLPGVYE